jgi:hypothetical protein
MIEITFINLDDEQEDNKMIENRKRIISKTFTWEHMYNIIIILFLFTKKHSCCYAHML